MARPLAEYVGNKDNNFNLIRFVAATLVLVTHSYALASGNVHLEPLRDWLGVTWGSIAVDIFFVTSGFLIAYSFFNKKSLVLFVWARFLRIYPGLFVAITFCVFIVGLFFTTEPILQYLTDTKTITYFVKNTILILGVEHQLPSVFHDTPHRYLVNASLWTLPYELTMYVILAAIGTTLAFINKAFKIKIKVFVFIAISVMGCSLTIINHFYNFAPQNIIRLFSLFFTGSTYYLLRDKIFLSHKIAILSVLLIAISLLNANVFFIALIFTIPYLVFYLAYIPNGKIRIFNKFGDYSYGIYIYAFPIQQSIAMLIPGISIIEMIWVSFIITFIFAFFSWHLVERKSLKLKKTLVFQSSNS